MSWYHQYLMYLVRVAIATVIGVTALQHAVNSAMAQGGLTPQRAQLIERLARVEAFDDPIEGEVAMDFNEDDVVVDEIQGDPLRYLEGYIDLSPMEEGDTVVIRHYVKLSPDTGYVKYAEESYSGKQDTPAIYITSKPAKYGIRITMQQTAGLPKVFRFQFFRHAIDWKGK